MQGKGWTWHICLTLFLCWSPSLEAAACLNKAGAGFEAATGVQVAVLADAVLLCIPCPLSAGHADLLWSICPGAVPHVDL